MKSPGYLEARQRVLQARIELQRRELAADVEGLVHSGSGVERVIGAARALFSLRGLLAAAGVLLALRRPGGAMRFASRALFALTLVRRAASIFARFRAAGER